MKYRFYIIFSCFFFFLLFNNLFKGLEVSKNVKTGYSKACDVHLICFGEET